VDHPTTLAQLQTCNGVHFGNDTHERIAMRDENAQMHSYAKRKSFADSRKLAGSEVFDEKHTYYEESAPLAATWVSHLREGRTFLRGQPIPGVIGS
jgi:hypothetical protein